MRIRVWEPYIQNKNMNLKNIINNKTNNNTTNIQYVRN